MTEIFAGSSVDGDGVFDPAALPAEVELALAKLSDALDDDVDVTEDVDDHARYQTEAENGSDSIAEEPVSGADQAALRAQAKWLGIDGLDTLGRPDNPMTTAEALQDRWLNPEGMDAIKYWRGSFWAHLGPNWVLIDDDDLRAKLYQLLKDAHYTGRNKAGKPVLKPWAPTPQKINGLLDAMKSTFNLHSTTEAGAWLRVERMVYDSTDPSADPRVEVLDVDYGHLAACQNVLVNPLTLETYAHTARYFNMNGLAFHYDQAAECPQWTAWLKSILDQESINLLQEITGYIVSGRTDLEKAFFLYGPPRSGKGTFTKVLTALIGRASVVAATTTAFMGSFGLEDWIGKSVAIFDDVRLPRDPGQLASIMERLLTITGQGEVPVNRKNKIQLSCKLDARIILASNDLLAFRDASGAMPNRLEMVEFTESFLGREEVGLANRLKTELPGIFNWALGGLRRLNENGGKFTRPTAAAEARQELLDGANPTIPFVREHCGRGPGQWVLVDELFHLYEQEHVKNGYSNIQSAKTAFGANLKKAFPDVKKVEWKAPRPGGRRWTIAYYTGLSINHESREPDIALGGEIVQKRSQLAEKLGE